MVRRNECPDMTIAVDWDVKHQTKTKPGHTHFCSVLICAMSGFIYCTFFAIMTAEYNYHILLRIPGAIILYISCYCDSRIELSQTFTHTRCHYIVHFLLL